MKYYPEGTKDQLVMYTWGGSQSHLGDSLGPNRFLPILTKKLRSWESNLSEKERSLQLTWRTVPQQAKGFPKTWASMASLA